MSRSNSSPVWKYMERRGESVYCRLCTASFKYSSSTSNLLKHFKTKHAAEYDDDYEPDIPKSKSSRDHIKPVAKTEPVIPPKVEKTVVNSYKEKKQPKKLTNEPRINSSPVWKYMERHGATVVCRICHSAFKSSQGTSNLIKHLKRSHPIECEELFEPAKPRPALPVRVQKASTPKSAQITARPVIATVADKRIKHREYMPRKQVLDIGVLMAITKDLQPFSLVEDKGFIRLVQDLDPKYELPTRQHLRRKLLPQIYEETKTKIAEELTNVKEVAITTDIWENQKSQAYMTVTCHFVTGDWDLKRYVLETVRLADTVTAVNIAEELNNVMTGWNIRQKVCSVVTDNTANIVTAVQQLGLTHIPCFANTLHLVVTEAIRKVDEVTQVQQKVKHILNHFHTSVKSAEMLEEIQKRHRRDVKKLIQDDESKFNFTYLMLQWYNEESEMITMTLCSVDRNEMCLTNSENIVIQEAIAALQPYEQITKELSGESFTPVSKVLPMIHSLLDYYCFHYSNIKANQLAAELLDQLKQYFPSLEERFPIAASTYLDPRFKKFAFARPESVKQIEDSIIRMVEMTDTDSQDISDNPVVQQAPNSLEQVQEAPGLWARFDVKISDHLNASSQSLMRSNLDIRRYNEEKPVRRDEDPVKWWKENQTLLPKLQGVAKGLLCIPATAVPPERLFSKAGDQMLQQRSNMKAANINKMLFLSQNY